MLAAVYVASYFLLLQPEAQTGLTGLNVTPYKLVAKYRMGGQVSRNLYFPLELADRVFWPAYWSGTYELDLSDLAIPIKSSAGTVIQKSSNPKVKRRIPASRWDQ